MKNKIRRFLGRIGANLGIRKVDRTLEEIKSQLTALESQLHGILRSFHNGQLLQLQLILTYQQLVQIIADNGITGEIDLFSLDVDGIDYWLWKNLEVITFSIEKLHSRYLKSTSTQSMI